MHANPVTLLATLTQYCKGNSYGFLPSPVIYVVITFWGTKHKLLKLSALHDATGTQLNLLKVKSTLIQHNNYLYNVLRTFCCVQYQDAVIQLIVSAVAEDQSPTGTRSRQDLSVEYQ